MAGRKKMGNFSLSVCIRYMILAMLNGNMIVQSESYFVVRYKILDTNMDFYAVISSNLKEQQQLFQDVNVTEIHLTETSINSIPEKLFHSKTISYLKLLNISHNNFTDLAETTFSGLSNLEFLDLSHNNIENLKQLLLYHQRELEIVSFSYNSVTSVPEEFFAWNNKLSSINFSNNLIKHLKENIFKILTCLEYIDLSHNKIVELPNTLFLNQKALKYIDFSHNQVMNLNKTIFTNKSKLTTVKFNHNNLASIPDLLFPDQNSMDFVNFSHNVIKSLPNKLTRRNYSINTIDFSHNMIESITNTSQVNKFKVKNISFRNNSISYISSEFTEMESIDLGYNRIDNLNFLSNLTKLKYLNLENNIIRTLPKTVFHSQKKLSTLDLSWNYLTKLELSTLSPLKSLRKLALDGNSLVCDCNLQKIALWCKNNSIDIKTRCLLEFNNSALSWYDIQHFDICMVNLTPSTMLNNSQWYTVSIIFITLSSLLLICIISILIFYWRLGLEAKETKDNYRSNSNENCVMKLPSTLPERTNEETRSSVENEYFPCGSDTYQYIDAPPVQKSPEESTSSEREVIEENTLYEVP